MNTSLFGTVGGLQLVSKAPRFDDLVKRAQDENIPEEQVFEEESYKRYKAIDNRGDVYEVQNPALMIHQVSCGATVVRRLTPKLVSSGGDGKPSKRGRGSVEPSQVSYDGVQI